MGELGVSVIKGTGQRLKVSLLFPDFMVTALGSPLGVIWFLSPPLQVGPHGGRHAARPWQAAALRVCGRGDHRLAFLHLMRAHARLCNHKSHGLQMAPQYLSGPTISASPPSTLATPSCF